MSMKLRERYLESISVQSASLSLLNITKFYYSYIKNNTDKVKSQLDRNGYFLLKNKLSTGNSSTTTRDIYISTYFLNVNREEDCSRMLQQKYHGEVNIQSIDGFFVPSTNELVVLVKVYDTNDIEKALKKADIRSIIEHELTHAFDHTNKSDKLAKQKNPNFDDNFLFACAYLGCATNSEITDLMTDDLFNRGNTSRCLYAISMILYKLFAITEFNAHQMSDLDHTHKANLNKSDNVRKALKKDIDIDASITKEMLSRAFSVNANECPQLWIIIGRVLNYMGYSVNSESPSTVYKFFTTRSMKLFDKFYSKKVKNQVKYIISLKEKENIKDSLIACIKKNKMSVGLSFWFSPVGKSDSYLCRIKANNNKVSLTVNHKEQTIIGNADAIYKRMIDAYSSKEKAAFDFATDNLVDIIVQSLERAFNNIMYEPVYDITVPQDEDQIYQSNKISSRFADLDWD